jgi:RNA recognition motif-containing protein
MGFLLVRKLQVQPVRAIPINIRGERIMNNKIYVGNLTEIITSEDLKDNFNDLGKCISAKVIKDRGTGKSKGFAFVEMATEQDAQDVIRKCKGVELDGNKLVVTLARPKDESKESGGEGPKKRRAV